MLKRKGKGFTLIELIGALVIIAIISLISIPLVMNIIRSSKENARKRSIDNYGRAVELAITQYLLDNGRFAIDVSQLNIEYSGDKVECGVEYINDNNTVYLEDCKVNGKDVIDYSYGEDRRPATLRLISQSNPISITNYNDGNKGEMYTFNHEATVQTPSLIDYRYIGNIPNNYVSFNNGETWRIIGVFSVDNGNGNYEQRVKLIRNESIGGKPWNSTGENEWVGSTMQIYLNDEYSLDDISKEMVVSSKYYLGGRGNVYIDGDSIYSSERSETTSSGRSKNWIGNVALMYLSDYIFTYALGVDDICYNTPGSCNNSGWLYLPENHLWTLMPRTSGAGNAFYIHSYGYLYGYGYDVSRSFGTSPVVYLNQNVRIKSGDGTIDNPYVFEL